MAWRVLPILAVALVLPSGSPAASGDVTKLFRTPSGNISCASEARSLSGYLRCDIRSGVKPLPQKPSSCKFDWGGGMTLTGNGRAQITCASDTVASSTAPVLRYGRTWRSGPFTCVSRRAGLRCRNVSGHGFLLSRTRSTRF